MEFLIFQCVPIAACPVTCQIPLSLLSSPPEPPLLQALFGPPGTSDQLCGPVVGFSASLSVLCWEPSSSGHSTPEVLSSAEQRRRRPRPAGDALFNPRSLPAELLPPVTGLRWDFMLPPAALQAWWFSQGSVLTVHLPSPYFTSLSTRL